MLPAMLLLGFRTSAGAADDAAAALETVLPCLRSVQRRPG
jgi:hypothetical protein